MKTKKWVKVLVTVILILAVTVVSLLLLERAIYRWRYKNLPAVAVSLRQDIEGDKCHAYWFVENRSSIDIHFIAGNVATGEIVPDTIGSSNYQHTLSVSSDDEEVTLAPGERYETEFVVEGMPKGNYKISVTAKTQEGTTGTMINHFLIE